IEFARAICTGRADLAATPGVGQSVRSLSETAARSGRGPRNLEHARRNVAPSRHRTMKDARGMRGQERTTAPEAQRLSRRQLGFGAVGFAAASFLAAATDRYGAAASGQIAGAALTQLATYSGWRTSWDIIIPVLAQSSFPRTFLLYDRAAGDA